MLFVKKKKKKIVDNKKNKYILYSALQKFGNVWFLENIMNPYYFLMCLLK